MNQKYSSDRLLNTQVKKRPSILPQKYINDRKEIDKLRKLFQEDFKTFLLNNILMSVQFFENYDRDIMEIRDRCLEEIFLQPYSFKCFEADTIHALIGQFVTYQKTNGTNKEVQQFIHPLRKYVTYDKVDVVHNLSSSNRKKLNSTTYQKLVIHTCENDWKEESGFVNVIASEQDPHRSDRPVEKSSIDYPGLLQTITTNEELEIGVKNQILQSGTVFGKDENLYYLKPGQRNKSYSLTVYRTNEKKSPDYIPRSCFKENNAITNQTRRVGIYLQKKKITKKMLISAAFKRHFTEVFISYLSDSMKYHNVKFETTIFQYDRIILMNNQAIHHIIPTLEVKAWPTEATDFPHSNKTNWLEWPTKVMQNTIKNSGYSLLPVGYYEATDEDNDYTLEWKIEFPKAEKYLMLHMMHTHIRCYVFTWILYKSFIETDQSWIYFGENHLMNLLFLMVRKDYDAWPEYSQGETLVKYLTNLCATLQKKNLKSFFLEKRNLYANLPLRVLHRIQTQFDRILQNPIPHLLKALSHLKYSENFYPQFDSLKLYNLLTVKNVEQYLNPTSPKLDCKRTKPHQIPLKIGKESIDEEELFAAENTPHRNKEEVLRFFINHFINIASQSRRYEGYDYSMLYLTHAKRLTAILPKKSCMSEIKDLQNRIINGMRHCKNQKINHNQNDTTQDNHDQPSKQENLRTTKIHNNFSQSSNIDLNEEHDFCTIGTKL